MKCIKKAKKLFWKKISELVKAHDWDRKAAAKGWFTPKVIVRMDGGLASQMNFFAVGYAAAKKAGLPLYLDVTWFEKNGKDLNGIDNRGFNLFNAFPRIREQYGDRLVTQKSISPVFMRLFSDSYAQREYTDYCPEAFTDRSMYLDNYYVDIRYIASEQSDLRKLMSFNQQLTDEEKELQTGIMGSTSCALHIRRGDFCGTIHEVCTEKYYTNAIARMRELHPDVVFYVFTNDEAWTENFLRPLQTGNEFKILKNRSEASPVTDMQLMSECKHAIISNSGFSFFPAFLTYDEHKHVIMPEIWFNGALREQSRDMCYMPGWIKLPID